MHLMRGEIFNIDNNKIFAFGGSKSYDIQDGVLNLDEEERIYEYRKKGVYFRIKDFSWWDLELPTEEEINFYSGGGSKLNETARSYKMIQEEIQKVDNVTFVWFTDGKGWNTARNNLKETFDTMENIYNILDMKNGIMNKIFK